VADSRLRVELDRIRLALAAVVKFKKSHFDEARAARLYATLLGYYGVDLAVPQEAATRVRESQLREALLAALEDWLRLTHDEEERRRLEQVLESAELNVDPFRARWRAARRQRDGAALRWLAEEPAVQILPATAIVLLARDLEKANERAAAEQVLRAGLDHYPSNFWLNNDLGLLLCDRQPSRAEEAVRYLMVAMALRSDIAGTHLNLGIALQQKGDVDDAVHRFRAASRIDASCYGVAFSQDGKLLAMCGADGSVRILDALESKVIRDWTWSSPNTGNRFFDGVLLAAEVRKGIELKPDFALAHCGLGANLAYRGRLDEAIAEYRKAIELKPDYALAHSGLGACLQGKGRWDEAIAEYRKAVQLKPDDAIAHCNLGLALQGKGRVDEAIAEHREALRLRPQYAEAHCNLGIALWCKGRVDEAIAEYRKALQTTGNFREAYVAHNYLGLALNATRREDEAITEFREAIRIKPDYPEAHCNLGLCLRWQGEFQQALQETRRGHELSLASKDPSWRRQSAEWVQRCERDVELDRRLPAYLVGKSTPASPAERIELAKLCARSRRPRTAVRFYEEAFAGQPRLADNLGAGHRYRAACVAALAAAGQGRDAGKLNSTERARMRRQACEWLRADLASWIKQTANGSPQASALLQKALADWQQDSDLASVRGEVALAKLPAEEQAAWRRLWTGVEQALATLRQKSNPPEKSARKP
jgi:tetratricopeptide (TPR) repeat protein